MRGIDCVKTAIFDSTVAHKCVNDFVTNCNRSGESYFETTGDVRTISESNNNPRSAVFHQDAGDKTG